MDFGLSVEQRDLTDAERAWLGKHDPIGERRADIDDGPATISEALRAHVVEAGFAGMFTSEVAATNVDLLVLAEAHGWAGSPVPLAEMAIGARLLEDLGHPRAESVAAGADVAIPTYPGESMHLEVVEDRLRIVGTTAPATGVIDADHVVVTAQLDDGRDIVAAIPVRDVEVRVLETLDLLRSWAVVEIDSHVEADDWTVLPSGEVGRVIDQIATFRAVDALGCADRLLGLSAEYAGQRTQFGQPIGSFQAIKHHLANMVLAVEASRSVLWAAAVALDDDADVASRSRAVSAAVAFVGRKASEVAQSALQVHGGIGFTWEHDVHLLLRRIKVDELLDGVVSEHRRRLVALPATA
ncbi:acyl-CoA dehydrogenase family protein [Gordonia sp. CPCC 206044]|uniref:acyl-CoA dehydrogenase family protein n=1 Tax=Gordonia sp. CPCC 206044 TaxID=3140793 RepID=UPI003AF3C770